MTALLGRGFLRPDAPPRGTPDRPAGSKSVELSITHRCTMRCRYCYSGHEVASRDGPLDMSDDVLDAACEWAVYRFGRDCAHVHLTTGTTGEALLRPEACERVRTNAVRLQDASGKRISHAVGSTNLTLAADEPVRALLSSAEHRVFCISIDGPSEIHDRMRIFPDGTGSYDKIVGSLAELMQRGQRLGAQAVITGDNPDVTRVFVHLCELGFDSIILRPVRAPHHEPFAIGPKTIDGVKRGFSDLITFLLGCDDTTLLAYLRHLWHEGDFLGRFLIRVSSRSKLVYRCPAGKDWACVDTNGDIYPCPGMIGRPELRIGSIFSDIEEAGHRLYRTELLVTRKRSCLDCWARYLCGGGC
ncbi:MAG: SPASM domain-containing protein, partial [Anaerolineae bacterium]|nr:SPASM domain-containing protein [Anaerolineae bacterium]